MITATRNAQNSLQKVHQALAEITAALLTKRIVLIVDIYLAARPSAYTSPVEAVSKDFRRESASINQSTATQKFFSTIKKVFRSSVWIY